MFFILYLAILFYFVIFNSRYYLEETEPRDPDSEENGQKKKGEKSNESYPPA